MHRNVFLAFVSLVTACSYDPGGVADNDTPAPDGPTPGLDRKCVSEPGSVLCLEFEQGIDDFSALPVALDGSSNEFDATADDVVAVTRTSAGIVSKAAGFGLTGFAARSHLVIDDDLGLGGNVTVEMWMRSLPGGTLFDSSRRFVMSHGDDQRIRCGINGGGNDDNNLRLDSTTRIDDADWHHVACTFDNTSKQATVYIDGAVAGCRELGSPIEPIASGIPIGTTIGSPHVDAPSLAPLIGALDSIHVYRHVLGADAICRSATGRTDCSTQCPPPPEGGSGQGGGQGGGFGGGEYGGGGD